MANPGSNLHFVHAYQTDGEISKLLQARLSTLEQNEKLCALAAYFLGRLYILGTDFIRQINKLLNLQTAERKDYLEIVLCLLENTKCMRCTILNSGATLSELIGKIAGYVSLNEINTDWWNETEEQFQALAADLSTQINALLTKLQCRALTNRILQRDLTESYISLCKCNAGLARLMSSENLTPGLVVDIIHDVYWEMNEHLEPNHLREMTVNPDLNKFEPSLLTGINLLLHDLTETDN